MVALSICVPAYLLFEPDAVVEQASALCLLLAAASAVLLCWSAGKAALAILRSRSYLFTCRQIGSSFVPMPLGIVDTVRIDESFRPRELLFRPGFLFLRFRNNRAVVFGMLFFFFNIVFLLQIVGAGQGFLAGNRLHAEF